MLLRIVVRLMVFYLVIVGLIATGGFAGVGPLADELAGQDVPLTGESVDELVDRDTESNTESPDIDDETVDQNATAADEQRVERLIHEEINDERAAEGLEPLETDEELQRVARGHSADMIEDGYVGHESPDGITPQDRLAEAGCQAGGENVAQSWIDEPVDTGSETVTVETEEELAAHLVEGWMNSPGHRENVLRDSFAESGIGVLIAEDNRVFATQKFCAGSMFGTLR